MKIELSGLILNFLVRQGGCRSRIWEVKAVGCRKGLPLVSEFKLLLLYKDHGGQEIRAELGEDVVEAWSSL